jgi:hypothetical protein
MLREAEAEIKGAALSPSVRLASSTLTQRYTFLLYSLFLFQETGANEKGHGHIR